MCAVWVYFISDLSFCRNLFGVVLNSFEMWIFDFSTFSLVRELKGCFNPITDACMSPDCRWVTAATADGWIKTWDMPTSG